MDILLIHKQREKITLSNKQSRGKRAITKKGLKQHERDAKRKSKRSGEQTLPKEKEKLALKRRARHEAQWEVIATDRSVLKALCK